MLSPRGACTFVVLLLGALTACRSAKPVVAASPDGVGSADAAEDDAARVAIPIVATPAPVHDPAHPPIDCPLRRHGIDPTDLRPFEEMESYIAFLDRPDREAWQKPDAIVAALGLTGSEVVADLGAGSGYFTFRFAGMLPRGRVVAIDIEPEMVRHVHHQAMVRGLSNVEATLADASDPSVPASADVVFVCDVLHHVAGREAWLAKLFGEMKAGARLALVEFREGPLPEGPPESVKLPRAALIDLATGAGFELVEDRQGFLPYQTYLVFRKPAVGPGTTPPG
jgi:SAM-dependent methyltransferase